MACDCILLSFSNRPWRMAGDAVKYWGIAYPQGECIPDILSTTGEGDAWVSLWNKKYPDSRHYSVKEFAEKYIALGFRPVKLEAVSGNKRNNAKRASRAVGRKKPSKGVHGRI